MRGMQGIRIRRQGDTETLVPAREEKASRQGKGAGEGGLPTRTLWCVLIVPHVYTFSCAVLRQGGETEVVQGQQGEEEGKTLAMYGCRHVPCWTFKGVRALWLP